MSDLLKSTVANIVDKSRTLSGIYYYLIDIKGYLDYRILHYRIQKHAQKYHDLPLEHKIVFANFNGRGYGCNPKYIANEIIRRDTGYDLVWLVSKIDPLMPSEIRQVDINSEDSYKELATASVIINNVKGELNFKKRNGQHYIETWHAAYSPKYLESAAGNSLGRAYIAESINNSLDTDIILSNSDAQTNEYKEHFWCNCQILEVGLPRNDLFFADSKAELMHNIKNQIGIPDDTKIVMYAPTFRGSENSINYYGLDIPRTLRAIREHFGGKWQFVTRLHPNIVPKECVGDFIDVSGYSDMQELLLVADILITDYSSSMFDMLEMDKRVFLFASDIDEYQSLRGLKQEYFEWGFPLARTNDELIHQIHIFNEGAYAASMQRTKSIYTTFDNGSASSKIADLIDRWLNE